MARTNSRQREYRRLSTWVQRVILGVSPPRSEARVNAEPRSSSEQGAESAQNLEFSASGPEEASALRTMGDSLKAFHDAPGPDSRSAIAAAAEELHDVCFDFANPPLNAIWADPGGDDEPPTLRGEGAWAIAAQAIWEQEGGSLGTSGEEAASPPGREGRG